MKKLTAFLLFSVIAATSFSQAVQNLVDTKKLTVRDTFNFLNTLKVNNTGITQLHNLNGGMSNFSIPNKIYVDSTRAKDSTRWVSLFRADNNIIGAKTWQNAATFNSTINGSYLNHLANTNSYSLGDVNAVAGGTNSLALGYNATTDYNYSIVMGSGSTTGADSAISVGKDAYAGFENSIAFGNYTTANDVNTVALGYRDTALFEGATSVGAFAGALDDYTVALGYNAKSTQQLAVSLGANAVAAFHGTAIGHDAVAVANQLKLGTATDTVVVPKNIYLLNIPQSSSIGDSLIVKTTAGLIKSRAQSDITGVNIYNTNGTLTGARTVTGGGNNITWSNVGTFRVTSNTSIPLTVVNSGSGAAIISTSVNNAGILASSTTGNGVTTFTTSGTGIQAQSTTGVGGLIYTAAGDTSDILQVQNDGLNKFQVRGTGKGIFSDSLQLKKIPQSALTTDSVLLKSSDGTVMSRVQSNIGLPSQTSNSGKFLSTNGTSSLWATINNGAADGATKGIVGFVASDFTAASGIISLKNTIASGTYTPMLTNTLNVTSSTPIVCHYTRNGNEITVTGSAGVVTTLATSTILSISLPVSSNFGATTDASGVGQASTAIATNAIVQANATSDLAELTFTGLAVSGSGILFFSFTYTVI